MKTRMTSLILTLFMGLLSVQAQQKHTVSGTVRDGKSGEVLSGAYVFVEAAPGNGTVSNEYGFYSLTLPAGDYRLAIQYMGYELRILDISLRGPVALPIELQPSSVQLAAVEVTPVTQVLSSPQAGLEPLAIRELNKIPVLLGEKDLIKTLQLLPGIKSAGEGSSGFYVRGGGRTKT